MNFTCYTFAFYIYSIRRPLETSIFLGGMDTPGHHRHAHALVYKWATSLRRGSHNKKLTQTSSYRRLIVAAAQRHPIHYNTKSFILLQVADSHIHVDISQQNVLTVSASPVVDGKQETVRRS